MGLFARNLLRFHVTLKALLFERDDQADLLNDCPSDWIEAPDAPVLTNLLDSPRCDGSEKVTGWNHPVHAPSLQEVHSSVPVPGEGATWYAKLFAFSGVGFMISVGYMDPGNWATDISGGSAFGYSLMSVIFMSSFIAMFLQNLAVKLGVVAERDLAQACRDAYPLWANYGLWILAEVSIAACDMAEIIGSATALYLLFSIPLWVGVLITAADVLLLLVFGSKDFRFLEVVVFTLCALIASCFIYELALAGPDWAKVAEGLMPEPVIITESQRLYVALGILGATVQPSNLYLHSSIIQTRAYPRNFGGKQMALLYGSIDSTIALSLAFFVNAAILVMAGAAFHYGPDGGTTVAYIADAYKLLAPALGARTAQIMFGVALLASGQNSTITGTLAGQVVMEGFLHVKLKAWVRRLLTRLMAIVPAAIVAVLGGIEGSGRLLVLSQVVLSLQLSFAMVPLVHFTGSKTRMGSFVNGWVTHVIAWGLAAAVAALNVHLIVVSFHT